MIYMVGDLHGDFCSNLYGDFRENMKKIANSSFIQVGDFGLGFQSMEKDLQELREFNNFLKENNNVMYVIRGNHDNPIFFTGTFTFSNLKLLPDYSVLNLEGKNFLCVGGGTSIDRVRRTPGVSFWEDEKINEITNEYPEIDILVTHVPHREVLGHDKPHDLLDHYMKLDITLHAKIEREVEILTGIFKSVKPKAWYSGHLHFSDAKEWKNCIHTILGIDEISPVVFNK